MKILSTNFNRTNYILYKLFLKTDVINTNYNNPKLSF